MQNGSGGVCVNIDLRHPSSPKDIMGNDIISKFSLAIARIIPRKRSHVLRMGCQSDADIVEHLQRTESAEVEGVPFVLGDWSLTLLYNDPENLISAGISRALTPDAEFPDHDHDVHEWIICYAGSLEIKHPDGPSQVLTNTSPAYHAIPGVVHSGRALAPNTQVFFINRPSLIVQ